MAERDILINVKKYHRRNTKLRAYVVDQASKLWGPVKDEGKEIIRCTTQVTKSNKRLWNGLDKIVGYTSSKSFEYDTLIFNWTHPSHTVLIAYIDGNGYPVIKNSLESPGREVPPFTNRSSKLEFYSQWFPPITGGHIHNVPILVPNQYLL